MLKVKSKDEDEEFDYIDMTDVAVAIENPNQRKKFPLKIESE